MNEQVIFKNAEGGFTMNAELFNAFDIEFYKGTKHKIYRYGQAFWNEFCCIHSLDEDTKLILDPLYYLSDEKAKVFISEHFTFVSTLSA